MKVDEVDDNQLFMPQPSITNDYYLKINILLPAFLNQRELGITPIDNQSVILSTHEYIRGLKAALIPNSR